MDDGLLTTVYRLLTTGHRLLTTGHRREETDVIACR